MKKYNRIDWTKTNSFGPESEKMADIDFTIKKEHLFLCNISDPDILKNPDKINQISNYSTIYKNAKLLCCCVLLDKCYSMESNIDSIDHECLEQFLRCDLNDEYENFEDFYEENQNKKISF